MPVVAQETESLELYRHVLVTVTASVASVTVSWTQGCLNEERFISASQWRHVPRALEDSSLSLARPARRRSFGTPSRLWIAHTASSYRRRGREVDRL